MSLLAINRISRGLPRLAFFRSYSSKEESHWLLDNKPGPYPRTEEEKCAAAKKYGLLREEYEPYPDDGNGYGDYPKIEPVPYDEINQHQIFTDGFYCRNFNEPINVHFIFYTCGRISRYKYEYSGFTMLCTLIGLVGSVFALLFLPPFSDYKYYPRVLNKQMPGPGLVHYTFEFDGDEETSSGH